MNVLLGSRAGWMALQAVLVTGGSLVAAYFTDNPNWVWNIPLGLTVGAMWGWITWTGARAVERRAKRKAQRHG